MFLSFLWRPSNGDPVHWASLCPGGWESYLHLPGHCQPSHHGLQVWIHVLIIFQVKGNKNDSVWYFKHNLTLTHPISPSNKCVCMSIPVTSECDRDNEWTSQSHAGGWLAVYLKRGQTSWLTAEPHMWLREKASRHVTDTLAPLPDQYYTLSGTKWGHQHKMAVSKIFCLFLFAHTIILCLQVSSIFTNVSNNCTKPL